MGGDRGPIETFNLTAVWHTHWVDTNGYIFFVFASKDYTPLMDVLSVGAIGTEDLLRLVSLDDMLDEEYTTFRVILLIWDALFSGDAFNKCARSCDALCECRNQQTTLIAADKQPCIEILHAAIDAILVAAKRIDAKNVTRNSLLEWLFSLSMMFLLCSDLSRFFTTCLHSALLQSDHSPSALSAPSWFLHIWSDQLLLLWSCSDLLAMICLDMLNQLCSVFHSSGYSHFSLNILPLRYTPPSSIIYIITHKLSIILIHNLLLSSSI